jgi:DNA repair exonuclease SbcCD ATPase subunit
VPTLKRLELRGYRSFGIAQRLDFGEPLALVWGGNSQGKTSVAEAVEFLLTGGTVRRELLGGDKGEYDDSLRNAYHPEGEEVSVTACIVDAAGNDRVVKRVLDCDYARKQDCRTTLTIDDAVHADVAPLGIPLAEPPLKAPVLFQHSVRYALSSRPSDRLAYFKALLEMGDLDVLTGAVSSVVAGLQGAETQAERDLVAAAADPLFADELASLRSEKPSGPRTRAAVHSAMGRALGHLGETVHGDQSFAERFVALRRVLDDRSQLAFDFGAWRPGPAPSSISPTELPETAAYEAAGREADEEVERLRVLFDAVLSVPALQDIDQPVDCPVCETPGALTPERLAVLRQRVRDVSGFARSQRAATDELQRLRSRLEALAAAVGGLVPRSYRYSEQEHREAQTAVNSILGDACASMSPARGAVDLLAERRDGLRSVVTEAMQAVEVALGDVRDGAAVDAAKVAATVAGAEAQIGPTAAARQAQVEAASAVLVPLRTALDRQAGTSAANAVLRLGQDVDSLLMALRERYATAVARAEYTAALKDIEKAKLAVFNAKFQAMSDEIARWWNLLRPNEPVAFHRAAPRGSGRRLVALEAKLRADGHEVVRDALGVLSDSQLNALGVAAFLARAVLQGTPLVVLDDPLQSGDDEHRDTFIDLVVPELLDAGLQVVVTTYDSQLKRLLTNAQALDGFTVSLDDPTDGTVVVKGTDTAEALLKEAKSFLRDTPSLRDTGAGKLRTAGERVAKEILVAKRTAQGERASLADYTKQTLEKLVPKLLEHLPDERERGHWKNVSPRLSPGAHDDEPPAKNTLLLVYQQLLESHRKHVRDAA